MDKPKLIGPAVGVLAVMFLTGQASAFQGKSVAASDCGYGGKIKSIEATDRLTITFSMCKPDPAFRAKAAFTLKSALFHPVSVGRWFDRTAWWFSAIREPRSVGLSRCLGKLDRHVV